jgi:hypothetical protein
MVTSSVYLYFIVPARRAAPSPYIGERVAYRARNPNGIFDWTNYFTELLYKATLIIDDTGAFFYHRS